MSYSEPLINQPRVLFLSIGVGVLMCIIYIAVQFTAKLFKNSKAAVYITDTVFCLLITLVSFFFMVLYNNGRVRLHLIAGEAFGFFAFYCSVGKYIHSFLNKVAEIITGITATLLRPYVIIIEYFSASMTALKRTMSERISAFIKKNRRNVNNAEKNQKKFNFIGKIHLKNSDKSV